MILLNLAYLVGGDIRKANLPRYSDVHYNGNEYLIKTTLCKSYKNDTYKQK